MAEEEALEEDRLEAFLPRLQDELALILEREAYRNRRAAFAHWAARQVTARLADSDLRQIGKQADQGLDLLSCRDPASPNGDLLAHVLWADAAPGIDQAKSAVAGMGRSLTDTLGDS